MGGFRELESYFQMALTALDQQGRLRSLTSQRLPSAGLIDLSHNDYLGLSHDVQFRAALTEISRLYPPGATGSRLLGGEHPLFNDLESEFATFKGAAAALYFSSGYAANEALAAVLSRSDCAFFSDALNHASTIDGIRLSRLPAERRHIFPHRRYDLLAEQLAASKAPVQLIFSETLFSMDGDFADLTALDALAKAHRGVLVLDEAHALGVYGPVGRGCIAAAGLSHAEIISVNTAGKALAVAGAFVAGPTWLRQALINYARPFIYSTGPSPWVAAALQCALRRQADLDPERALLAKAHSDLRQALQTAGWNTGTSASHILPLIVGDEKKALDLEAQLRRQQIIARAIRPPTVPVGAARLRLSLNAGLSPAAWERLQEALLGLAKP